MQCMKEKCEAWADQISESGVAFIYRCAKGHIFPMPKPDPEPSPEPVKDGYEAPPLSHRDGPETEKMAADKIAPSAEAWRAKSRDAAYEAREHGVIGWELCERWGMLESQSTVRARLTELCDDKHGRVLTRTNRKRPNGRRSQNPEMVYVATRYMRPEWEL